MTRPAACTCGGFGVGGVAAGIADVRIGQRDDLAAVRGIGQDLLIAAHRGVENDFADRSAFSTNGDAAKERAVGKGEKRG